MIYECAYCRKLYDEKDGIMCLAEFPSVVGMKAIYVFKCKNCMSEKGREKFDKFKEKI
ncbi:MAG: hypothetical protein ABIK21_04400 [bacterium]